MDVSIIDIISRVASVTIKSHGHACAKIVPIKPQPKKISTDPVFGMWNGHEGMADAYKYVRNLREGSSL